MGAAPNQASPKPGCLRRAAPGAACPYPGSQNSYLLDTFAYVPDGWRRRLIPMRLGYFFWVGAILSTSWFAHELWLRRRKKVDGSSKPHWWRLALPALPLLALLITLGLAWTGTRYIRTLVSTLRSGDIVKAESFFAEQVNLGSKQFVPGAECAAEMRKSFIGSITGNDGRIELLPLIDPYDLGHLYILPITDSVMPSLTLYRLRLSSRGWKIDQLISRGCAVPEEESRLMRRLVDIPGWW